MIATKRLPIAFLLGAMLITAACGGTGGNLGSLPPASPTPERKPGSRSRPDGRTQRVAIRRTDVRAVVRAQPRDPRRHRSPPPRRPRRMIVRAYFVLGGELGVEGLVPTLSEVPKSVAVGVSGHACAPRWGT